MRTTIRLADESRDTLLNLAQERGDRGVSRIVEEAVAFYLTERNRPVIAPTLVTAPPPPGRWQRVGAELDQRLAPGVLTLVRDLLRDGLRRLPLPRV